MYTLSRVHLSRVHLSRANFLYSHDLGDAQLTWNKVYFYLETYPGVAGIPASIILIKDGCSLAFSLTCLLVRRRELRERK